MARLYRISAAQASHVLSFSTLMWIFLGVSLVLSSLMLAFRPDAYVWVAGGLFGAVFGLGLERIYLLLGKRGRIALTAGLLCVAAGLTFGALRDGFAALDALRAQTPNP